MEVILSNNPQEPRASLPVHQENHSNFHLKGERRPSRFLLSKINEVPAKAKKNHRFLGG